MLRQYVTAGAFCLAVTTSPGAEPAASLMSAEFTDGLFRVEASSGQALAASRPGGQLRLVVETRDVARSEVARGKLAAGTTPVATSSLAARAVLQPRTSRQPLVTLFDHLEKPNPQATAEQLTLGLDYRVAESSDLPFEVAKSGSLGDREDGHNLMLRAQFSF